MAKVEATNFGEFSTVGTDYFETNTTGGTMAFNVANYANFFPNGAGQSFSWGGAGAAGAALKSVAANAEYYAHIRQRIGSSGEQGLIAFYEGSTNHIQIVQLAAGQIEARRAGTVLATGTTVFPVTIGRVLDVQVRVVISDSTGVVQVRINGQTSNEIDFSGDTRNAGTGIVNNIGPYQSATNQNGQFADFVVHDTSGSFANSWTGACRVVLGAFTISGGSGQQWTPLSSTNVSNIDDTVPGAHDGDTTYIEDSTANHKDFYQLASSVFTGMSPASISYVVVKYWARAADGGSHTMRSDAKAGGTTVNGSTITLGSTYARYEDAYYQDPSTSAAWASFSAITAAEFGPELIS